MSSPTPPPTTAPLYDGGCYVLDDSVGHQLAGLMHQMRREVELRMAAHGLTDAQWKPLMLLQSGRATTPQELSRCTLSDAGAMTRLLDRLVAKGLVERERSDTDRRVVQLTLTAAGHEAAAQVPYVLADVNNQFLAGFSHAEWTHLRTLIARMTVNGQALRTADGQADDSSSTEQQAPAQTEGTPR